MIQKDEYAKNSQVNFSLGKNQETNITEIYGRFKVFSLLVSFLYNEHYSKLTFKKLFSAFFGTSGYIFMEETLIN